MSLNGFGNLGKSIAEDGKYHYQYSYKSAVPAPGTAGFFVDCNQTSGSPKYNAFAGGALTATQLIGSGNAGVYVGSGISGSTKHLLRWNASVNGTNSVPMTINLCDYLLFYPLIDCDDVDIQPMDNTLSLPRYESGDGVRIVLIATAPMTATASCTITYTNSDGVSGRTSTSNVIPATAIGVCATGVGAAGGAGQVSPFFNLASGDAGVRSIESIQFSSSAGGFICAALVKPIEKLQLYEINVTTEKMFGFDYLGAPEIKDGAYLNFLIHRNSGTTQTAYLTQEFIFINS